MLDAIYLGVVLGMVCLNSILLHTTYILKGDTAGLPIGGIDGINALYMHDVDLLQRVALCLDEEEEDNECETATTYGEN
jgi:hypothetical protein